MTCAEAGYGKSWLRMEQLHRMQCLTIDWISFLASWRRGLLAEQGKDASGFHHEGFDIGVFRQGRACRSWQNDAVFYQAKLVKLSTSARNHRWDIRRWSFHSLKVRLRIAEENGERRGVKRYQHLGNGIGRWHRFLGVMNS